MNRIEISIERLEQILAEAEIARAHNSSLSNLIVITSGTDPDTPKEVLLKSFYEEESDTTLYTAPVVEAGDACSFNLERVEEFVGKILSGGGWASDSSILEDYELTEKEKELVMLKIASRGRLVFEEEIPEDWETAPFESWATDRVLCDVNDVQMYWNGVRSQI